MRQRPGSLRTGNYENGRDLSKMRWTVDYEEDFSFITKIFEKFTGRETEFDMGDILHSLFIGQVTDNAISHEFRNVTLRESGARDV